MTGYQTSSTRLLRCYAEPEGKKRHHEHGDGYHCEGRPEAGTSGHRPNEVGKHHGSHAARELEDRVSHSCVPAREPAQ